MTERPILPLLVPLLSLLVGCGRDPLAVATGGKENLVIARTGWFDNDLEVCVTENLRRCVAVLRVDSPAEISAEWRSEREVEIFLVGGEVALCRERAHGDRIVRLHRAEFDSYQPRRLAGGHQRAREAFHGLPDSCPDPG